MFSTFTITEIINLEAFVICQCFLFGTVCYFTTWKVFTLYYTKFFRYVQIESICMRQIKCMSNNTTVPWKRRKHSGKRKKNYGYLHFFLFQRNVFKRCFHQAPLTHNPDF